MKTAVSIPDKLFNAADQYARAHGLSRSRLYAEAIRQYLEQQPQSHITDQLNKVYAGKPPQLDSNISAMQFQSLGEDW
jgi:metal-responsive CopG/Arc/MetJ family transcriptional regulator